MGFKLRREVRDHLPPGLLTAGERSLVLELADYCGDDTREGWPGAEWLAAKADVPESKVGEMFARVARKWVELRVPLGFGKDGRPFYARSGQRTMFRFPAFAADPVEAPQNGGPSPDEAPQNGVPEGTQNRGAEAPQNGGARDPKMGGPSPQGSPQRTTSPPPSGDLGPSASLATSPEGEEIEEDRKDRLANRVQQIRPAWGRRSIHQAIAVAVEDRRPWPAIEYAFPIVAEDPDTNAPGRLNADGPWWNQPEPARAPEPLPAGVHEFQPATTPDDTACAQCALPRTNRYHYRPAAPNWDTSIHDQRYARAERKRTNGHQPFRNPDPADYHQPL